LKESVRISLFSLYNEMAYRAVLAFLIFTITQETSANFPFLLAGGSSRPGKILRGMRFIFSPANRNGLDQT
jgi:hypothetical protein